MSEVEVWNSPKLLNRHLKHLFRSKQNSHCVTHMQEQSFLKILPPLSPWLLYIHTSIYIFCIWCAHTLWHTIHLVKKTTKKNLSFKYHGAVFLKAVIPFQLQRSKALQIKVTLTHVCAQRFSEESHFKRQSLWGHRSARKQTHSQNWLLDLLICGESILQWRIQFQTPLTVTADEGTGQQSHAGDGQQL